jgi:hypothetical protein
MFSTSHPEGVNRNFDAKECATRTASAIREPVHHSLEPLFDLRSSRAASSILATWIRRARTPRRRRLWPLRVLQGLLGPAEQKGHRRLSGATGIAGIIDLLMVAIYPGSPSFVQQRTFKGTPGTKIRWTICYRIEREYCQGSGRAALRDLTSPYNSGRLSSGRMPMVNFLQDHCERDFGPIRLFHRAPLGSWVVGTPTMFP